MSLRVADARLLAAHPVRRALLFGPLPGWDVALAAAGVVVGGREGPVDLAVAAPGHARAAAESGAATVLSLRAAGRAFRVAGYATTPVLVRNGPAGPRLLVPVGRGSGPAAAHAFRSVATPVWRRAAVGAFAAAARMGAPLPGIITVGGRTTGPPAMVAAASAAGLRRLGPWYLSAGAGDDLQRLTWFCFEPGATEPSWVVKGSRVRGHRASLDHDQEGLALLAGLPSELRRHATTVLGRFEADGLPGAVETAAPGQPLHETLRHRADAASLIERIADWVIAVGRATSGPPDGLATERARIDADVLPHWTPRAGLAAALPVLRPVVQHNDLGCWNIVASQSTFTVVDWESARPAGLPLWDLAYFLVDALSTLATDARAGDRLPAALALVRGDLPESAILARILARGAAAAGVPLVSVGPVVTMGWLHHGLSAAARDATRRDASVVGAGHDGAVVGPLERLAEPWLVDPRLGFEWLAFRESLRP